QASVEEGRLFAEAYSPALLLLVEAYLEPLLQLDEAGIHVSLEVIESRVDLVEPCVDTGKARIRVGSELVQVLLGRQCVRHGSRERFGLAYQRARERSRWPAAR